MSEAVVFFYGSSRAPARPLVKLLRQGFRHCDMALCHNDLWIGITAGGPRVAVEPMPHEWSPELWIARSGAMALALEAPARWEPGLPRPALLSCVGIIKAVLGVRHPLVLTPYQLFRHLRSKGAADVRHLGHVLGAEGQEAAGAPAAS